MENSPVLLYHIWEVIQENASKNIIMAIALSEFIILSLISFLSSVESEVIYRLTIDTRLRGNRGVILPLGSATRVVIGYLGFLNMIEGCLFSPALAFLAYCRSAEVYWDSLDIESPFPRYEFANGSLEGFSEAIFTGQCWRLDGLRNLVTRFNFLKYIKVKYEELRKR